jgi:hypothetical protein
LSFPVDARDRQTGDCDVAGGEARGGSFIFDQVVPQLSRWSVMDALLVAIEQ